MRVAGRRGCRQHASRRLSSRRHGSRHHTTRAAAAARATGRRGPAAVATLLVAGSLPAAAQNLLDVVPVSLTVPDHPRVEYYAAAYASPALRSWMQRVLERTAFYAHHILEQLEQRDMPAELLFLPAIESDYHGRATSPAGAAGLWQLMRGTAQLYGLVTNDVLDERRDFWKATDVALRILEANQRELGSWELGAGGVQRWDRPGAPRGAGGRHAGFLGVAPPRQVAARDQGFRAALLRPGAGAAQLSRSRLAAAARALPLAAGHGAGWGGAEPARPAQRRARRSPGARQCRAALRPDPFRTRQ